MGGSITWLGCDLVTGAIIEELPDLTPAGPISALLGNYTSAAFTLPLGSGHGAPPREWEDATTPGRTMIVGILGGTPIWAGAVLRRVGGSDAAVSISAVTLEGYLDRRFVSDHSWAAQDEASVIAAGLIADAQTEGIAFEVDAPATGTLRDRVYLSQDDKSVFSALRELMGVQNGPEWTVSLAWNDDTQRAVSKILVVRSRIGYASANPSAVMSSVGASSATYALDEDYTSGRGANHIIATSSGEGTSRPQSDPARDEARLAGGMPRWEMRFSPATSISDKGILDAHAQAALDVVGGGVHSVSISARADAYPVLGVDWSIGDDVAFDLRGSRHPDGLTGIARALGWELDTVSGLVTPVLLSPTALA